MNRKVTVFLNILGLLLVSAWTPGASAASWSTRICNPPPTYGPYNISGGKMYYCPAAGSYDDKSVFTGGLAGVINKCNEPDCTVVVTKTLRLADAFPNTAIQCRVPGNVVCNKKGCGGSPDSSSDNFLKLIQANQETTPVGPGSCTDKETGSPIHCTVGSHFTGLEGNATAAGEICPNANWSIFKQLWLRTFVDVTVTQDNSDGSQTSDTVTLYCELVDPQNNRPDDYPNYFPDLNTPKNNTYFCFQP